MLRPYQRDGVNQVMRNWADGSSSELLVIPTGGGKTKCAGEVARRVKEAGRRTLGVVHRQELVRQMQERIGDFSVDVVSIQGLVSSLPHPAWFRQFNCCIIDEAHHYVAEEWKKPIELLAHAKKLGLTATPERGDGKPMGDMFENMVVATNYSHLIENGWLVPAKVFQPPQQIDTGLATDIVSAYEQFGEGGQAFVYCGSVDHAHDVCDSFLERGISAASVVGSTIDAKRDRDVQSFRRGQLRVLCNVHCLTEGVDVPQAQVCILARNITHPSTYLQCAGRVLRPHHTKSYGLLIDLVGASLAHGLPTEDREYSLEGRAIQRQSTTAIRMCMFCGYTYEGSGPKCPNCDQRLPPQVRKKEPVIYSMELREVYAGPDTPEAAKMAELLRLRVEAWKRKWSLDYVAKQYRGLFSEEPPPHVFSPEEKEREWTRFCEQARRNGASIKQAQARYKKRFDEWPAWKTIVRDKW